MAACRIGGDLRVYPTLSLWSCLLTTEFTHLLYISNRCQSLASVFALLTVFYSESVPVTGMQQALLGVEWTRERIWAELSVSCALSRSWKKVLVCSLLLCPPSHAPCVPLPQEWRTRQNVSRASRAPSAISQVRSVAKCVPETPTLRKEPKNASSVQRTPSFQVGLIFVHLYSRLFSF